MESLHNSIAACNWNYSAKATFVSLYLKINGCHNIWPEVESFDSAKNLRILSIVTNPFLN